jgi:hypothetical protein
MFHHPLHALTDALATFGPPFKASAAARNTDLPLARFIFHHFVLTFPFLSSAPPNFFADKVQVFIDRFLERNISGTDDRSEETKRRRITAKLESTVTLLIASAIKIGGEVGAEEIVKVSDEDREKMSIAQARFKAALAGKPFKFGDATFDVNVVGVRTRTTKGRLRSRVHEEFIIRTRRAGHPDAFVSRRYGDFERLADTLRAEYPDEDVSRPPAKDRSNTEVAGTAPTENAPDRSRLSTAGSIGSFDDLAISQDPQASSSTLNSSHTLPTGPLAREKNRLTLRAYLRALLAIPPVADSVALADFLLGEPTTLTYAEEADARSREALDAVRAEEGARFTAESAKRAAMLKGHLNAFKEDLVKRDGLSRVFATIKSTPKMEQLPESYRALLGWARISAASTLFSLFMGNDNSSDLFGQLKRIHGLMPYFMMRQMLRISNPVSMIRGVIDLFLAQPFGQRSLLQRMFSSSLQEEARELSEVIAAVSEKIGDEVLCEKIRLYVNAPLEVQQVFKDDAEEERVDLITTILRSPTEPRLGRPQIHRVIRASRSYEVYKSHRASLKNPEQDEGPQDEDAWLYEDLHVLLKLQTRLRDKEQMLSLIFEGVTSELLKDIVTIFYSPLAQVYKAANIADSLYDLQVFVNDLIKTVEANEELSYTEPQKTVQVFIDLVARHEAKFYAFVHQVHSKGAGLFDGLMHWIELFLNFVRSGDPTDSSAHGRPEDSEDQGAVQRQGLGAVDLEVCLPAGGQDRRTALAEIDALVVYAYRVKLLRELKLQRRIADREVRGAGASAEVVPDPSRAKEDKEQDESVFFDSVMDNLGIGGTFTGEMEDAEAEDELYESDSDEEEEGDGDGESVSDAAGAEGGRDGAYMDANYYSSSGESDVEEEEGEVGASNAERLGREAFGSSNIWRPPVQRGDSVLTITGSLTPRVEKDLPSLPVPPKNNRDTDDGRGRELPRRRKKQSKPKPPTLKAIPEMVPLFVEMVRPLLRPARTASGTSHASAAVAAPPQEAQEAAPAAAGGGRGPPGGWGIW